jgi:hypothetical protein
VAAGAATRGGHVAAARHVCGRPRSRLASGRSYADLLEILIIFLNFTILLVLNTLFRDLPIANARIILDCVCSLQKSIVRSMINDMHTYTCVRM